MVKAALMRSQKRKSAGRERRRKGMGEQAIQHRRSYSLEAERKMGEILLATERAKGELKRGPVVMSRNHGESPTLSALGFQA